MFRGVQSNDQKEQHAIPTSTTTRPPKEHGRKVYSDLQGPRHKHIVWNRHQLSTTSLGLVATPSRAHTQHVMTSHGHTYNFSTHISLGATQLQCKSFCTTRLQGGSPYHARCTQDVGRPHSKWILHRKCVGALQMPRGVHQLNQAYMHLGNHIFPPHVPHHAHYYASRCTH